MHLPTRMLRRYCLPGAVILILLMYIVVWWRNDDNSPERWERRRLVVESVLDESWAAYRTHAFGNDSFHPLSQVGSNAASDPLGLTIIEALSTLILTGRVSDARMCRDWIASHLNFNQDVSVNVYQATTRVLGGLLSAYHLSADPLYLRKADDLGKRLSGALKSATGVPYSTVNLRHGITPGSTNEPVKVSESSAIHLEFRYLSYLTGNRKLWLQVPAYGVDLWPARFDADSGLFTESRVTWGPHYSILAKLWLQSGRSDKKSYISFSHAVRGLHQHLVRHSKPSNLLFIGELPGGLGTQLSPKMDISDCSTGSVLSIVGSDENLDFAEELAQSCAELNFRMPLGIAPAAAIFSRGPGGNFMDFVPDGNMRFNLQRADIAETLLTLWRVTGDIKYREWGWKIFSSYVKSTHVGPGRGYAGVTDVSRRPGVLVDHVDPAWFSVTLKYFWLLFNDATELDLNATVFTSQGHPLPVLLSSELETVFPWLHDSTKDDNSDAAEDSSKHGVTPGTDGSTISDSIADTLIVNAPNEVPVDNATTASV